MISYIKNIFQRKPSQIKVQSNIKDLIEDNKLYEQMIKAMGAAEAYDKILELTKPQDMSKENVAIILDLRQEAWSKVQQICILHKIKRNEL